MSAGSRIKKLGLAVTLVACTTFAADTQKEFRYNVGNGATLNVVNEFGTVTVRPSSSRQVVIGATAHSGKVEIDSSQTFNRIEARSHVLGNPSEDEATVDYDIQVPPDVLLTVHNAGGPIRVDKVRGDMTLEGDTSPITVQDSSNAHMHIRTVAGPVTLSNISNGHVEVTSVSGDVLMTSVSGPKVAVNTTKGNILYTGDVAGGGNYSFNTHSGDIDVALPPSASVDLSARSVTGSVQQDFPLRQKTHLAFQPNPGRAFAGTSNKGASSVQLRSFSGKIRVKKQ